MSFVNSFSVQDLETIFSIVDTRFYSRNSKMHHTKETILLRDLKILLDTDLKIILLNHRNNFGILKIMSNATKKF